MSLTRRWWVTVLALATLAGALSLLAGRALGYDPTSWQVWGDELAHATLHTAGGGPAWKPLPVFVDALFAPTRIELWQGRPNRLHDRFCYTRQDDSSWRIERLAP